MNFHFVVFISLLLNFVYGNPTVHTKLGTIEGTTVSENGTSVYRFLGIPYAQPPVRELRFREPQPLERFHKGIVHAKYTFRCLQWLTSLNNKVIGVENCLYLNIYTTNLDTNANHDVIVFIHGGGFFYGAGHTYTQEYLFDANINLVYVSINYRLGPFGFLSTEDDVVPGNNGLKDQVMALQWIQENIRYFGGNPAKVTIAGMSAGGISVHLHYLSPMSRDLFAHGISMSGGALSPLVKTKDARKEAEHLARLMNCTTDSSAAMVACLRDVDGNTMLTKMLAEERPWDIYNSYVNFLPVIEKGGNKPFLNEHPFLLFRKGRVKNAPWLASTTTSEGLKPAAFFVEKENLMQALDENWNEIAPYLLLYQEITSEMKLHISKQIREHYLKEETISIENRNKLVKLIGDRLYMSNIENVIRLHASSTKAPVYFYMFDYRGKYSMSSQFSNTKTDLGTSHIDDLIYILKMNKMEPLEEDSAMVKRMVNIWVSFIKNGVPDAQNQVEWPKLPRNAVYKGDIPYVKIINSTLFEVTSSPDISQRQFWDSLPLNELHVSGDRKVPKHIRTQQEGGWVIHNFVDLLHYKVFEPVHHNVVEPVLYKVVKPLSSKITQYILLYGVNPLYCHVFEPLQRRVFEPTLLNIQGLLKKADKREHDSIVEPIDKHVLNPLHNKFVPPPANNENQPLENEETVGVDSGSEYRPSSEIFRSGKTKIVATKKLFKKSTKWT